MKKITVVISMFFIYANAGYTEGKSVFEKKCSSCHGDYVPSKKLKENFFEKNNTLLNMRAPTVNMLSYAIMDSPTHIGDRSDPQMQQVEIEEYLKEYLYTPDPENSICDRHIMKYYDKKKSMKGEVTEDEIVDLALFFMQYKKNRLKKYPKIKKILSEKYGSKEMLSDAKRENRIIIVEASSKSCYFCKKMKREVIDTDEIQRLLEKDFIFVEIDIDSVNLPFDLKKSFKGITPSFFFVSKSGKLMSSFPGSWSVKDFTMILNENLKRKEH